MLTKNIKALEVYSRLRLKIEVTLGGVMYTGFERSEINAVMDVLQVPHSERHQLLDKILFMENKEIQIKSEANGG